MKFTNCLYPVSSTRQVVNCLWQVVNCLLTLSHTRRLASHTMCDWGRRTSRCKEVHMQALTTHSHRHGSWLTCNSARTTVKPRILTHPLSIAGLITTTRERYAAVITRGDGIAEGWIRQKVVNRLLIGTHHPNH